MDKKVVLTLILIIFVVSISGCTKKSSETKIDLLKDECVSVCKNALVNEMNLTNGPCLLNHMSDPHWVCDVAHSPREPVDNLKENQCSAYGKTANHFIEVNPECKIIRIR